MVKLIGVEGSFFTLASARAAAETCFAVNSAMLIFFWFGGRRVTFGIFSYSTPFFRNGIFFTVFKITGTTN